MSITFIKVSIWYPSLIYILIINRKRHLLTSLVCSSNFNSILINKSLLPNGGKNTDLYLIIEIIFCMKVWEKAVLVVYVFMCIHRKLQTLTIKIIRTCLLPRPPFVFHVPIYFYLSHVLIYLWNTHIVQFKFTENNSKLGKYMFNFHI